MDPRTHDAWLAQAGAAAGARLARIGEHQQDNVYEADLLTLAGDGSLSAQDDRTIEVVNIAESPDAGGALPAATDLIVLDVQGRWIPIAPAAAPALACRVVSSSGDAAYTVRPQTHGVAGFSDDSSAADLTATNLAELNLGPGGAVGVDEIVLVREVASSAAPAYVFERPVYAKYLD